MKKRLLSFLLTVVMVLSLMPATAFAVDLPEGATWLVDEGGNYVWYKLEESNTKLTIGGSGAMPDFADDNGQPWVDKKANIQSVVIEPGVTNIGNNAFAKCTSLASITIPDSVKNIGQRAFDRSGLLNVLIPASVTNIGSDVFNACTSLTSIQVNNANTAFESDGDVLFDKGKSTLICYPAAKTGTDYTIPSTVTSIGERAFQSCSNLTKIEIPSTVTSIGARAFQECTNLISVEIPENLSKINTYTFYRCTSLAAVKIPSSVTNIANSAFRECSKLSSVTVCSTTPPTLRVDVFTGCAIELINVPQESVDAYEAADGWKDYAENIVGAKIHDGVIFTAWGDGVGQATTLPAIAGNYYLTTNVAISLAWDVPTGATPTSLDLNGHVIKADTSSSSFSAITIKAGATLNLYDCNATNQTHYYKYSSIAAWTYIASPSATQIASAVAIESITDNTEIVAISGGAITGGKGNPDNNNTDGGGVYSNGVFNMYGGTICGNKATDQGGGVHVGGTFNMYGGAIRGNTTINLGGGVHVAGTFNMQGGVIEYNTDTTENGDWGGGGVAIYDKGKAALSGGEIRYNSSNTAGGGILILYNHSSQQKVTMAGVSIINNTAGTRGGGVCVTVDAGTPIVGGSTKITGNVIGGEIVDGILSGGAINNFYLSSGKYIQLGTGDDKPQPGMSVGVTTATVPNENNPVTISAIDAFVDHLDYFFSDNSDYCVECDDESKVLKLSTKYPLWVGGIQVTLGNKNDVLSDAAVIYDNATHTLTLSGAAIDCISGEENGIYAEREELTIVLADGTKNCIGSVENSNPISHENYNVALGIVACENIVFTGGGNLVIYDSTKGINSLGGDIIFDENFTGKLNIYDYGYQEASEPQPPACTISAGENVIISGGSFDLISYNSNGINASGSIYINDCEEIKVKSCTDGGMAISAEHSLTIADTLEVTNANVKYTAETKKLAGKNGGYLTIKPKQGVAPVYYYGGDVTYYDVVTSAGANGTIDVDKKSASYGSTVTVTVTPEKGFALETLTVLDKDGKEIEVKDTKEKNKYTFRMPSSKVTVNATFMEDNTILNYCVDVKKERYYYEPVLWSYENEICKGTDELHFSPNKTLTRAEAVTMLWRIAGKPVVNYWMQFKDVESGRYYTEAVRWAAAEKIAVGYSDEKFGTTDLITREQLATMIYGYVQKKGQGFTGSWMFLLPYNDRARISDWANEAAHWCSMKGVINGKDGNLFDPQGTATRAEAVTMLYRFDSLMK